MRLMASAPPFLWLLGGERIRDGPSERSMPG